MLESLLRRRIASGPVDTNSLPWRAVLHTVVPVTLVLEPVSTKSTAILYANYSHVTDLQILVYDISFVKCSTFTFPYIK